MTVQAEEMTTVAAGRWTRWGWLALGYAALGLGAVGAFLPLLPTTPFLLVAAGAFARSSPAMRRWLHEHRHFGRFLKDWHEQGAIPTRGKVAAVVGLTASWVLIASTTDGALAPALAGAGMAAVAAYVVTRPRPARESA